MVRRAGLPFSLFRRGLSQASSIALWESLHPQQCGSVSQRCIKLNGRQACYMRGSPGWLGMLLL